MSKPIFQDVFKFSGRRNRKSYILLLVSQIVALLLLSVVAMFGFALLNSFAPLGYLLILSAFVGIGAVIVSGWAAGSQRIRDFGHSGVWILLVLIPYVGWIASLAICFIPSSPGENRYGSSCI